MLQAWRTMISLDQPFCHCSSASGITRTGIVARMLCLVSLLACVMYLPERSVAVESVAVGAAIKAYVTGGVAVGRVQAGSVAAYQQLQETVRPDDELLANALGSGLG